MEKDRLVYAPGGVTFTLPKDRLNRRGDVNRAGRTGHRAAQGCEPVTVRTFADLTVFVIPAKAGIHSFQRVTGFPQTRE